MKKSILLFACTNAMFYTFAQEIPVEKPKPSLSKEEYLQKSKGQRTGAIVMISAGAATTIAGFAVAINEVENDLQNGVNAIFNPTAANTTNDNGTFAPALIITGVAAMLGSIGLFVSAHKNKQKALNISFKNEPAPQVHRSTVFYKSVPSLNLKIRLW